MIKCDYTIQLMIRSGDMNIQTTMILKLVACINVIILDGREEVNHTITGT